MTRPRLLTRMNGLPLRYGVVTDFGFGSRREVLSAHTTPEAARRKIRAETVADYLGYDWNYWIAEIDPTEAAQLRMGEDDPVGRQYGGIQILRYLPEGPYRFANRPDPEKPAGS
jgi:hypothetical protein